MGEQILRQRGPLDKGVATGAREELGQPGWQPQELSAGAPATAIAAAVFPAIEAQPAVPKKVAGPAVRKAPAPTAKKEEAKPKQGGPVPRIAAIQATLHRGHCECNKSSNTLSELARGMADFAQSVKSKDEPQKLFVDTKGIGKPERFSNGLRKWGQLPISCKHFWEGF